MKESTLDSTNPTTAKQKHIVKPKDALADLAIFLSAMFLVRAIYIESFGFWGNAMFNSLAVVTVATLLLRNRRQSWKDLGLKRPQNYLKMLGVSAINLIGTVVAIMLFEIFFRDLFASTSEADTRFSEIKGNIPYLFSILFFVWIESFLEELQDRGFSLNRFESLFSKIPLATVLAVIAQAIIFGFRHSYDFSPRSVTTGLIGLVFGLIYVLTGRNLWPLIIAHIILNSMSMIERL